MSIGNDRIPLPITYALHRSVTVSTARPSLRQEQRTSTRRRIAEAARRCFYDVGVAETSVDQIARAAGVGRATLYLHFANKDAILLELLASNLSGVWLIFRDLCELDRIDRSAMRAWLWRYVETLRAHRDAMRLFHVGLANDPAARSLVDDHRDAILLLLDARFPSLDLALPRPRALALLVLARIDHLASAAVEEHPRLDVYSGIDLVSDELVAMFGDQPE